MVLLRVVLLSRVSCSGHNFQRRADRHLGELCQSPQDGIIPILTKPHIEQNRIATHLEGWDFSLCERKELLASFVFLLGFDFHRMRLLFRLGVFLGSKMRREGFGLGGGGVGVGAVLPVHETTHENDGGRRQSQNEDEGEGTHHEGRG